MNKLNKEKCYYLDTGNALFFDVDDTLIMHALEDGNDLSKCITIKDPHLTGYEADYFPHSSHINTLKRNHHRGKTIIVWSAAGVEWAKAVVEALKLEKYVTLILEKPTVYVDDIPIEKWGPKRIYIKNNGGK